MSTAIPVHAGDIDLLIKRANRFFGPLPDAMPGSHNDSPQRVALGRQLFFEQRLSVNDSQSCASCHRLDEGFAGVDNLPTSPGARGEQGTRNSPTVLNAGWQDAQFWDGRAEDLVEQAKQPILNPIEMGMPDEATVVEKSAPSTTIAPASPGRLRTNSRRSLTRISPKPSPHLNAA